MKDGQDKRDGIVESPGGTWLFCEDSYGPPPVTNLEIFLDFLNLCAAYGLLKYPRLVSTLC